MAKNVKKVRCPYCGAEIDHLIAKEKFLVKHVAEIIDRKLVVTQSNNEKFEGQGLDGFYCPKCDKFITDKYGEAERFLLGEDIFKEE